MNSDGFQWSGYVLFVRVGAAFNCRVRPTVNTVCGFRTCAGAVSGGNSGGLIGKSESSLI